MLTRSLGRTAAALVLAGASLAGSAVAAQAAPGGCNPRNLCVYYDSGYNGRLFNFAQTNSSWGGYAIEDDDSSWFNNGTSGLAVRVYDDRGFGGGDKCFSRGNGDGYAFATDDRGSSNQWVSRC